MTTPADLPRPFGLGHTAEGYHHHCYFCSSCVLGHGTAPTYAGSDGQCHVICSDCAGNPAKAAEDRDQRLREEERYSFLWVDEEEEEEDGEGDEDAAEGVEDSAESAAGVPGPCCACRQDVPLLRNLMMLPVRAPEAGTGWGCFVCHLPPDGAVAAVCDACLDAGAEILDVCAGYPSTGQRVARETCTHLFEHDQAAHDAVERQHAEAWRTGDLEGLLPPRREETP